jgi:hypothetical protein
MAMTWEQIGLYADLVQRRQVEVVDLVLGPVVAATTGKKWKGYTTKRRKLAKVTPAATTKRTDAQTLGALAAFGFRIGVEPPKSGG